VAVEVMLKVEAVEAVVLGGKTIYQWYLTRTTQW
jgi:hypothetical protein